MAALGWHTALPQNVFFGSSGDWETPVDWNEGYMPIVPQDAFIGNYYNPNAVAICNNNVTVNSIGTSGTLVIANGSTFTATNGTVLSYATTGETSSGNSGAVEVDPGSTLVIGNVFYNSGRLYVGAAPNLGEGFLSLSGTVSLTGGGTVMVGQLNFTTYNTGSITGGGLVNVDNTIAGGGIIALANLDNQAGGTIAANQFEAAALKIAASDFTNEGTLTADTGATLELASAPTQSFFNLTSDGEIAVDGGGVLAIDGPGYSIWNSGTIALGTTTGSGGSVTIGGTLDLDGGDTVDLGQSISQHSLPVRSRAKACSMRTTRSPGAGRSTSPASRMRPEGRWSPTSREGMRFTLTPLRSPTKGP